MNKLKQTPLKDEYDQILRSVGAPELAARYLYEQMRNGGPLELVVVYIAPDLRHTVTWLTPSDPEKWRHVQAIAGDVSLEPPDGYPFVRHVDPDRQYPIAAPPTMTAAHPSDETRPPERRREPVTMYDRPKRRRQSLLQEMLDAILRRKYLQGVPETTSTSAVWQQVATAWEAECQARGRKPTEPPSWDTINRKLGRSRH